MMKGALPGGALLRYGGAIAGIPPSSVDSPEPFFRTHRGIAMNDQNDAQQDLIQRGYSRRDAARILGVLGAGVAVATAGTPVWAQRNDGPEEGNFPKVRIGSNECWTGPFPVAQAAAAKIVSHANFYHPGTEVTDFKKALATIEGVPVDYVLPWPGSSDPLSRIVVAFCSPQKGLVTADVSYEQPWGTAEWAGAKVTKVPLTPDYRHDVKAMLAANPDAGLYYICLLYTSPSPRDS